MLAMCCRRPVSCLASAAFCLALPAFLHAADAPACPEGVESSASQWPPGRGACGQGDRDDAKVPLTWDEKENVVWKAKLPGRGNSSPVVWGDRIYLTASDDKGDERYVICVRSTDGTILWKQTASKGVSPGRTHNWN